jgi:hypothetical protein
MAKHPVRRSPGYDENEWAAPRGSETRDPITGRDTATLSTRTRRRVQRWKLPPAIRRLDRPVPAPRRADLAGRGPKYTRVDDRVHEDVCDRLTADPVVDATEIDVRVVRGEVTLEGEVRTRDQKRRAEHVAASAPGVCDVVNRLRLVSR